MCVRMPMNVRMLRYLVLRRTRQPGVLHRAMHLCLRFAKRLPACDLDMPTWSVADL